MYRRSNFGNEMDTPKMPTPSLRVSDRDCEDIIMKEDSGYVTVTPSSAELTGIDNSLPSGRYHYGRKSSNTPQTCINNNNISGTYLLPKITIDDESPGLAEHGDQNTLTRVLENVNDAVSDTPKFEIKGKSRLKRRNSMATLHEAAGTDTSPSQGINNRFKELAIDSNHKSEYLLNDDTMLRNSTPMLPGCNRQRRRSHSGKSSSLPYPITPVKNKRRRLSPQSIDSPSSSEEFSPIFNFSTQNSLQKIGETEKNKLLYPNIPVTPPKKVRTPEKLKKQIARRANVKCRKNLMKKESDYCGFDYIDFFKLLATQGDPIEYILRKLSDEDLDNVCKVNNQWKEVCLSISAAKKRWKKYSQKQILEKENLLTQNSKLLKPTSLFGSKCLMEVQNSMNLIPPVRKIISRSPPVSPRKREYNRFLKAAPVGSKEKLRKCPRCRFPANIKGKYATCRGVGCGFVFCIKCLGEKIDYLECCQKQIEPLSPTKKEQSQALAGSKSSRKNLRSMFRRT